MAQLIFVALGPFLTLKNVRPEEKNFFEILPANKKVWLSLAHTTKIYWKIIFKNVTQF